MSVSLLFRLSNKNHSEEMVLVGTKAAYAVARTLGKKSGTAVKVEGPFPFSPVGFFSCGYCDNIAPKHNTDSQFCSQDCAAMAEHYEGVDYEACGCFQADCTDAYCVHERENDARLNA